jgi:hypothetical protein
MEDGFLALDFSNAFNTLSRHHVAAMVQRDAHSLLGIFRFFYNLPSALLVRGRNGRIHEILSQEGGRQGDPLFPFFFSLGVKDLVQELSERFALQVPLTEGNGDVSSKRLIWAYLDDVCLALKPGVTMEMVMAFLEDPVVVSKYGLRVNRAKSWAMDKQDLVTTGHELLGSWIGGPNDAGSGGSEMTLNAAKKLRDIAPVLNALTMQEGMLLLRHCFHPILNYYLRTLLPDVGTEGVLEFDRVTWDIVSGWVKDDTVNPLAERIIRLPMRLRGLGLSDGRTVKPIAVSASLTQSMGFLSSRGQALTGSIMPVMQPAMEELANNLNVPVHDLMEGELWREKELQRRGCEVVREYQWAAVANSLIGQHLIRFLEGSGVLARSWLSAIPSEKAVRLSNDQVRYGLRLCLLSKFRDVRAPSNICPDCPGSVADDPCHHLVCTATRHLATNRHTSLKHITALMLSKAGCKHVLMEQPFGMTRDGVLGKSDVLATVGDTRHHYDLTVRTVDYSRRFRMPEDDEVAAEVELDKARGQVTRQDAFFFWEDHDNETPHPATVFLRKLRQMLLERTVGLDLAAADGDKRRKYGPEMIPMSFTALGCLGRGTRCLVRDVINQFGEADLARKVAWRTETHRRWSCSLLKTAQLMSSHRAGRAMLGH